MFFETEIGTPIVCVMIIFFYREIDRGTEVILLKDGVRVAVGIIREIKQPKSYVCRTLNCCQRERSF